MPRDQVPAPFDAPNVGLWLGPRAHLVHYPVRGGKDVNIVAVVMPLGFETIGTHAAAGVVSQLRLDLVDSRLRGNPTALDGAESAEVATVAVNGVDTLETTFSRYLPQVVLAIVVPVAVLVLVAWIDPISAALMLLTLPFIPVFMWLVGRYTERRTQARWQFKVGLKVAVVAHAHQGHLLAGIRFNVDV